MVHFVLLPKYKFLSKHSPQHNQSRHYGKLLFRMAVSTLLAFSSTSTAGYVDEHCFHDALCDFGYQCIDDVCQPIAYQRHLLSGAEPRSPSHALPGDGDVAGHIDEHCFHDALCDFGYQCIDDVCQPIGHQRHLLGPKSSGYTKTAPKTEKKGVKFAETDDDVKMIDSESDDDMRKSVHQNDDPPPSFSVADATDLLGLPRDWDPKVHIPNDGAPGIAWVREKEYIIKIKEVYEKWGNSDGNHGNLLGEAVDILMEQLGDHNPDLDRFYFTATQEEKIQAAALMMGLPDGWNPKVQEGETVAGKKAEIDDKWNKQQDLGTGKPGFMQQFVFPRSFLEGQVDTQNVVVPDVEEQEQPMLPRTLSGLGGGTIASTDEEAASHSSAGRSGSDPVSTVSTVPVNGDDKHPMSVEDHTAAWRSWQQQQAPSQAKGKTRGGVSSKV